MTHPMRCREMCESAAGVSPLHPDQGDALDPPLTAQCAVDHELVKGKALIAGFGAAKAPTSSCMTGNIEEDADGGH